MPSRFGTPGEELVQRLVRDGAAEARIDFAVDRARRDHALDEPDRRAVGETLELGDAEGRPRPKVVEQHRIGDLRRPRERPAGPVETALPAVCARQRGSFAGIRRRERAQRPEPLALGRRLIQPPGERGERPPLRPPGDVLGAVERAHLVPERARLPRRALVACRLTDEVEALGRASARGVEEEALARDRSPA